LGLSLWTGVGCLQIDPFLCQIDSDCIVDGVSGRCMVSEQTCVYPDGGCAVTQWSTASGECVPGPADSGADVGSGEGSAGATSDSQTGEGTLSLDGSTTSPSTNPGDSSGDGPMEETTSGSPVGCQGPVDELTAQGVVMASSVFSDDFHAYLAVDGSFASSWFSSGPENGGLPSLYTWTVLEPLCISQITITGNGLHQNPGFQENFGFENVIVRVYDEADALVFQQMFGMAGTPDPAVVAFPDVEGVRVELELYDHESDNCGGFSELQIVGN